MKNSPDMRGKAAVVFLLLVAVLGTAGGYWFGSRSPAPSAAAPASTGASAQPKLLNYRNPMGLPDTSPMPKKDSMGMDYVAVYADEADEPAADEDSSGSAPKRIQKLGVRSEPVERRAIDRVRARGRQDRARRTPPCMRSPRNSRAASSACRSMSPVRWSGSGQPLFDAYSPELVSAQREYAIADAGPCRNRSGSRRPKRAGLGMRALADASLARLKNWDISDEQIAQPCAAARTAGAR